MTPDDSPPLRSGKQTDTLVPRRRLSFHAAALAAWGPGLLVMLADTDAGNVVTAAQSGSIWGYRLLPILLMLIPVLILVQDLAVRVGLYSRQDFGVLIRERFGLIGGILAACALIAATLGSLITELTGIAGVGELYGASRWIILPLASLTLITVVLTGEYRRVERIAIMFGLFELSFFVVAWWSHPHVGEIIHDMIDQKVSDPGYLYLVAGLIGATFNPWMIFYQASAISEKRLTADHYNAARWDTISGACLTQMATAAVLVAVAALNRSNAGQVAGPSIGSIGEISNVLTPLLGDIVGRAVFGAGVVGASMAAAIVSSLACAWGVGEIFGISRSLEQKGHNRRYYIISYTLWVIGSSILVLLVSDLVWLSVAMQVVNAVLLPLVVTFLIILAATSLPLQGRLRGLHLKITVIAVSLVSIAGLIGAVAGLF